ncbi:MAG TPA: FAD-linked oxidase C-terminal domain-containing protein [bacterium]|nr:FAD-linked oxidase C-terminal domain-containing protein [bacterium]
MNPKDVERFQQIVGRENARTSPADLYVYGSDASVHFARPDIVLMPGNIDEIQDILRYANSWEIPVVPRGAGSGMSGQAVPIDGGIVLDMKRMNHILEIRPQDMLCRVEAGVVDDDLNRALKPYGFMYPPAPASSRIATIGGEIANNASGVRSVKYGATRDSVLGLKVVLASGKLVDMGTLTHVEATGYQLARLIVGSEGTLAVIVEATLKIVPIPKYRCLGIACYNRLEDAGHAITEIICSRCSASMIELMDNVAITAVNETLKLGLPDVEAIILFEADGMLQVTVDGELDAIKAACEKHNGFNIETSCDPDERSRIFAGRKKLFASLSRYKKGYACTSLADDMAVPYSKMAEMAGKIHEVGDRYNVIMTAYGHCGSGCMHAKILMDPTKKSQWEDAKRAVAEIYEYVNSVGGTTSAEHGIGLSKAPAFKLEKADSLELMRAIKRVFDPNNILNPHKLFDAPDDWLTATELRYPVESR